MFFYTIWNYFFAPKVKVRVAVVPSRTWIEARVLAATSVEFDQLMAFAFLNGGTHTMPMIEKVVGQMMGKVHGCEYFIPVRDWQPSVKGAAIITFPSLGGLIATKVAQKQESIRAEWGMVEEVAYYPATEYGGSKTERTLI